MSGSGGGKTAKGIFEDHKFDKQPKHPFKPIRHNISEEVFEKYRASLKVVSDIQFKRSIEESLDNGGDPKFSEILRNSEFFKDLYFNGFIQGMDYARKL